MQFLFGVVFYLKILCVSVPLWWMLRRHFYLFTSCLLTLKFSVSPCLCGGCYDVTFSLPYVSGEGRIRTSEGFANRFTVCPLWPLGNLSTCNTHALLSIFFQRSSHRRESNPRPEVYKTPALPLSYGGDGGFGAPSSNCAIFVPTFCSAPSRWARDKWR
jgi:hypothetical protein